MGEIIERCEKRHAYQQTGQIVSGSVYWDTNSSGLGYEVWTTVVSLLSYVLPVCYTNVEFVLQVSAQAMQQVVQPTSPSESQATVPTITSQAYTSQTASVPIMSSVPQYINGHHVSQSLLLLLSRVKHRLQMDQEFKINDFQVVEIEKIDKNAMFLSSMKHLP